MGIVISTEEDPTQNAISSNNNKLITLNAICTAPNHAPYESIGIMCSYTELTELATIVAFGKKILGKSTPFNELHSGYRSLRQCCTGLVREGFYILFLTTKSTSPKEYVFGCEGKITLFSFPKEPSVNGITSMSQLPDSRYTKASRAHDSLAPPTVRLQERDCFGRGAVQQYLSFTNLIKLKTLWRYEGCNTTL